MGEKMGWVKKLSVYGVWAFGIFMFAFFVSYIASGFSFLTLSFLFLMIVSASYYLLFNWENFKSFLKSRSAKRGIEASFLSLMMLSLLVVLYLIIRNHPVRLDLTANKLYSLSDQTKKVLDSLTDEVHITAFVNEDVFLNEDHRVLCEYVRTLLKRYEEYSDKVKVVFVDPVKDPATAQKFSVNSLVAVIFSYRGHTKKVTDRQLMVWERGGRWKFTGEETFTSSILSLMESKEKIVYFVRGHGEKDIDNKDTFGYRVLRDFLENENFKIRKINLYEVKDIPNDCSVLIIAGPEEMISQVEQKKIKRYLKKGGKLMLLVDPIFERNAAQFLNFLTSDWGILLDNNVVVEENPAYSLYYEGRPYIIFPDLRYHPITKDLIQRDEKVVLVFAMGLLKTNVEGYIYAPLLQTSKDSYGEKNIRRGGFTTGKDKKDIQGPLTVAYAIRKVLTNASTNVVKNGETNKVVLKGFIDDETRIVVVGDSDFVANAYLRFSSGNLDFFLNALEWLVRKEKLISIRPISYEIRPLALSKSAGKWVTVIVLLVIPFLFVLIGLIIWRVRKRKEFVDESEEEK